MNHELNNVRKVGLKFSPTPLPADPSASEIEIDDGIEMGKVKAGIPLLDKSKPTAPKVTKVKRIG